MNSISGLSAEVFLDIVDNDEGVNGTSEDQQVFDVVLGRASLLILYLHCMLAVESVGDGASCIQCVQNLVGILGKYKKRLSSFEISLIKKFRV